MELILKPVSLISWFANPIVKYPIAMHPIFTEFPFVISTVGISEDPLAFLHSVKHRSFVDSAILIYLPHQFGFWFRAGRIGA